MSKAQLILAIIQAALAGLSTIPAAGVAAGAGLAFVQIIQSGMAAYQAETGKPLDLTQIPLETPVV